MNKFALLLLAAVSLPAAAADRAAEERELNACVERAAGVDLDAAQCYGEASESADQRMNAAFRKLRAELAPEAFAKLQAAQRRWLEFRDADIEARRAAMPSPGTLDRMLMESAYYDLVRSRADVLEAWDGSEPAAAPRVDADPVGDDRAYLLESAAADFADHGPAPAHFRNVRFGYVEGAGGSQMALLCGQFQAADSEEWTDFATLKTSKYEQWIGDKGNGFCERPPIGWEPEDLSAELLRRFEEKK